MPKRTNEFQDLVALVERALAPKGAKITESAELKVDGLDTVREVDVLIEGEYGTYSLKIAVEARDNKRKVDLTAFDAFLAKYRGECRVNVDKFVLVSRSGFTKGVKEKALKADVELLTLEEAKGKDWSAVGPGKFQFTNPPHICKIEFDPPIVGVDMNLLMHQGRLICSKGHDHGTLFANAKCLIFHKYFPANPDVVADFMKQVSESPGGQGMLTLTYNRPGNSVRFDGRDHPIDAMAIKVHAVSQAGTSTHTTYQRQSSKGQSEVIHHIQGQAGGKQLTVVIPGGLPQRIPPQIVLRIDDAPQGNS